MSSERVRHEIKRLISESDALAERVATFADGARYARTPEKVHEIYQDLREARDHVALALDALSGKPSRQLVKVEKEDQPRSWLRERVAGISKALLARQVEEEAPQTEQPTREGGFQGDSWSIPLPDIIGLLQIQQKTGELLVDMANEKIRMQFKGGELVSAFSDNTPQGQRLGEILVDMEVIDEERLRSFLNCFSSSRVRLGEAMLRGELVDRGLLKEAIERQVQLLFHRLIQTTEATYRFREGPIETGQESSRLNVTHLLLESARYIDESAA